MRSRYEVGSFDSVRHFWATAPHLSANTRGEGITADAKTRLAALMNAHDVTEGYRKVVPDGFEPQHEIPARLVLQMPFLRPGTQASKVQCPIFFALCALDTVAPAKVSRGHVSKAPKGVVKWYDDMGHFDIYVGEHHERAFKDYAEFLKENLPA